MDKVNVIIDGLICLTAIYNLIRYEKAKDMDKKKDVFMSAALFIGIMIYLNTLVSIY